jgi:hypothetical protein
MTKRQVAFFLEDEHREWAVQQAASEGRSVSGFVRMLFLEAMEYRKQHPRETPVTALERVS